MGRVDDWKQIVNPVADIIKLMVGWDPTGWGGGEIFCITFSN